MAPANDDYVHVIGTSVNLDYKAEGGGPFPRDPAECWFSLLWQLCSEKCAYRGVSPSVCLNFMEDREKRSFLACLNTVLAGTASLFTQIPGTVSLVPHDPALPKVPVQPSVWTYSRALFKAPPKDGVEPPAAQEPDPMDELCAGHDTVYNGTAGERNRERIFLVYGNRQGPGPPAYCDDVNSVPVVEKVLLVRTILDYLAEAAVNFRAFVHDDRLARRKDFFSRYLLDHWDLVGVAQEIHAAAAVERAYHETVEPGPPGPTDDLDTVADGGAGSPEPAVEAAVDEVPVDPSSVTEPRELSCSELRRVYGETRRLGHLDKLEACHVEISPDQRFVLYLAVDREDNVFLSGNAGTGKSFITRVLIREFGLRDRSHGVTAFTGKAAVIIGGRTLNSYTGVGLGKGSYAKVRANVFKGGPAELNAALRAWRQDDILVNDESSMIPSELFVILDQLGRELRSRENVPWGGKQLVFVGDFCQLPPVVKRGDPTPKHRYCFQTDSWRESVRWELELEKMYRQNDPTFIALLNAMRKGKLSPDQRALLRSREIRVVDEAEKTGELYTTATRIYPRKDRVAEINNAEMGRLEGEAHTYAWTLKFNQDVPLSPDQKTGTLAYFEKNLAVDASQVLKVGARVLCTVNLDPEAKIVNGSSGVITGFTQARMNLRTRVWEPAYPIVRFDETGDQRAMTPKRWYRELRATKTAVPGKTAGKRKRVGKGKEGKSDAGEEDEEDDEGDDNWAAYVEQVPLQLGWAITVHRAQGMTLRSAIVGARQMFERGQMYVAVSRVQTIEGLFLDGIDLSKLLVDKVVVGYYDRIQEQKRRLFRSFAPAVTGSATSTGPPDQQYDELRGDREFRLLFADLFRAYRRRK